MRQRARVLPPVGSLSRRLERPGRARQKPGNSASSPTWVAELRHLGHLLAWERQQVAGELEAEQPGHHPAPLCDTSIATGTFPSYALFPAPHTAFKIILFVAQILKKTTNNIYIPTFESIVIEGLHEANVKPLGMPGVRSRLCSQSQHPIHAQPRKQQMSLSTGVSSSAHTGCWRHRQRLHPLCHNTGSCPKCFLD